jgi:hypothetical protein
MKTLIKIIGNCYFVTDNEIFINSILDSIGIKDLSKENIIKLILNFPKQYPCFVQISFKIKDKHLTNIDIIEEQINIDFIKLIESHYNQSLIGRQIVFPENVYEYYQDFHKKISIPSNIIFTICKFDGENDFWLTAPGYDQINNYFNGKICVHKEIVVKYLLNPEKDETKF